MADVATLFPAHFVKAIQRLRLTMPRPYPTPSTGEHPTRQAGEGLDFRDFRPYAPGDDLRRVDWNIYRRSRRITVRLYDSLRRIPVYILVDRSASMFFEQPPRAQTAFQVAATLASAALAAHDSVRIHPFASELAPALLPTIANRRGLPEILRALSDVQPGDQTDLQRVLTQFQRTPHTTGLIVLISDFFDERGLDHALAPLNRMRDRLLLVQITHPEDDAPLPDEELELIDCETQSRVRVSTGNTIRAEYDRARVRFTQTLRSFAARRRGFLARIRTDRAVLEQIGPLVSAGILVTD